MLAEMAAGCAKFMRQKAGEVLHTFVLPAMRDAHHRVRWAAVNACAQLCNDYAPDFQREHGAAAMPAIVAMIADPVPRVAAHAALCVVDFCAGIEQEEDARAIISPFTDATLAALLALLQRQPSFKAVRTATTTTTRLDTSIAS